MKSFEYELSKYKERLNDNIDIIRKIVLLNNDPKRVELLLNPKDERELFIADKELNILLNIYSLIYASIDNSVIKSEDSKTEELFVNIINAYKKGDKELLESIKNKEILSLDMKSASKLVFDLICDVYSDQDQFIFDLAAKCGFDLNYELEALDFQNYLNMSKEVTDAKKIFPDNYEDATDEDINNLDEFDKYFQKLCEERIIDKSYVRRLNY